MNEPGGAGSEVRVSTVVGDRLCIRCGFNLTGQSVVREPHYNMLMVRCPECSTVAALQEYPALGKWADRWAALLAGAWLLVMVALLFAAGGAMFGFTMLTAEGFGNTFAEHISHRFNEWVKAQPDKDAALGGNAQWLGTQSDSAGSLVTTAWWEQQDKAAMLAEIGGPLRALDWRGLWQWPWLGLAGVIAGMVWTVVMLARSRRWVMAAMVLPIGLAGTFAFFMLTESSGSGWMGGMESASGLASQRLAPIVVPGLLISGLAAMWAGVWIGRPLVRGLVRAFLPPRMIGSLAFLWLADGKEVPRPGRRSAT